MPIWRICLAIWLFGALLMWFVLTAYGRRLGWVWVVMAGVAGNLAVAAVFYPERFAGVGASTAVFAAVGLLVAHGMVWSHAGAGLQAAPTVAGAVRRRSGVARGVWFRRRGQQRRSRRACRRIRGRGAGGGRRLVVAPVVPGP